MFGFLGYNFFKDVNCLDPTPVDITSLNNTKIQNGVFDRVYITGDVSFNDPSEIPDGWDFNTIFDAQFNDNLDAGNVQELFSNVSAIKIKRRVVGEFDWVTLKTITINTSDDLHFVFNDFTNICYMNYEYAIVPIINNSESNYLTEEVFSKFNGIFICDINNVFKFFADTDYSATNTVHKVGTYEPFGREYPIVVSNGLLQYDTGRFSSLILPDDFKRTRNLDRKSIVDKRKAIIKSLTNKTPKILKDWNGNSWIVFFTGKPQTDYAKEYGMGIQRITCDWTQIGDAENYQHLFTNGLISG